MSKICSVCNRDLDISNFQLVKTLKSGVKVYRNLCRKCRGNKDYIRRSIPEIRLAANKRRRERNTALRKDWTMRAYWVLMDSKGTDRKKGRQNNLTVEWIENQFNHGCKYCLKKQTDCKMGLDRIDNTLGHTTDNTVPCCGFCNFLRRDMPLLAWNMLIPGLRKAVKLGLFEEWTPDLHAKREKAKAMIINN